MHHPVLPSSEVLIVHQMMVKEELRRNYPELYQVVPDHRRSGLANPMRRLAGRALIALGTRLDPAADGAFPSAGRTTA